MRTSALYLCLLSLSMGCDLFPSESGDTGVSRSDDCSLPEDVETLLLDNATGLMTEMAFVGQVTDSSRPEYVYAISLYDQVASAGWMLFVGCDDAETAFEATCGETAMSDEAYWSCVRPTCLDESTLQIDAWYTEYGNTEIGGAEAFSLDAASTGGTLSFPEDPVHSWTMASAVDYATVDVHHAVTADHTGEDGVVTDVSYAVTGSVVHGDVHPNFELEIEYPRLEDGHSWAMTLSFDEHGLVGALLRDGVQVATVEDVTPSDGHDLVLALGWEGCAEEAHLAPDPSSLPCPRNARIRCDPEPM